MLITMFYIFIAYIKLYILKYSISITCNFSAWYVLLNGDWKICASNWIYIEISVDDGIDLFHLIKIYQNLCFLTCLWHYYYHQLNNYTFYVYNQQIQGLFYCLLHFDLSHIFSITFVKLLTSILLSLGYYLWSNYFVSWYKVDRTKTST